nr:skin secretory protein xP2-like [Aegilops tauschii subsp. strangulata]
MAPKKKPGATAHPSISKVPPPAATYAAGDAEAHEDVGTAGDAVDAGGGVTTSPAAETGAGSTGGEQHQQDPSGHAPRGTGKGVIPPVPLPLAEGHNQSGGARSGANRRPPAAPATGTAAACAPPPEQVDPATVPNGAAGPQAPSPRHRALQVAGSQQQGRDAVATGTVRSRAMVRSTSSSPMPSTATEAMARAQLLLRFPSAADQMDEWRATIQSLIGFVEAGGSQRAGPSQPPQAMTTTRGAGHTEGATPRCSPHPGNQRRSGRTKNPTMPRWPLPTLEHVQVNGEHRRSGRGETRTSSSSDAATTTAGPMGAMVSMLMSLRSRTAGACLLRLGALPLLMSCSKSVGHPLARSSQRYQRSMMEG